MMLIDGSVNNDGGVLEASRCFLVICRSGILAGLDTLHKARHVQLIYDHGSSPQFVKSAI
jgi:hypothetical protein